MRDIIKHVAEVQHRCEREYADVAELADALDSGSSGSDTVGVQVPSSAPKTRSFDRAFFVVSAGRIDASASRAQKKWMSRPRKRFASGACFLLAYRHLDR